MVLGASKAVGVCPARVGVAKGIDCLAHQVVRLDRWVLLGELAIGLGRLNGASDLNRRGHARRTVSVELAELVVAGLLVKEDVNASDGDQLLVAGGNERELLKLWREAKERTELGVAQVFGGDLVHDATHGLCRVTEKVNLGGVKDLRRHCPGHGPTVVERVRGEKVPITSLPALDVSGKVACGREELVLKRTSVKASHMCHFLITNVAERQFGERCEYVCEELSNR